MAFRQTDLYSLHGRILLIDKWSEYRWWWGKYHSHNYLPIVFFALLTIPIRIALSTIFSFGESIG